jgi:hypothetical protein
MNSDRERSQDRRSHVGGMEKEFVPMTAFDQVREHMTVIGADGAPIGTVDRIEENRIKLIRADSGVAHHDHHHYIPRGLVAAVEGDTVRLTARADALESIFQSEEDDGA